MYSDLNEGESSELPKCHLWAFSLLTSFKLHVVKRLAVLITPAQSLMTLIPGSLSSLPPLLLFLLFDDLTVSWIIHLRQGVSLIYCVLSVNLSPLLLFSTLKTLFLSRSMQGRNRLQM